MPDQIKLPDLRTPAADRTRGRVSSEPNAAATGPLRRQQGSDISQLLAASARSGSPRAQRVARGQIANLSSEFSSALAQTALQDRLQAAQVAGAEKSRGRALQLADMRLQLQDMKLQSDRQRLLLREEARKSLDPTTLDRAFQIGTGLAEAGADVIDMWDAYSKAQSAKAVQEQAQALQALQTLPVGTEPTIESLNFLELTSSSVGTGGGAGGGTAGAAGAGTAGGAGGAAGGAAGGVSGAGAGAGAGGAGSTLATGGGLGGAGIGLGVVGGGVFAGAIADAVVNSGGARTRQLERQSFEGQRNIRRRREGRQSILDRIRGGSSA